MIARRNPATVAPPIGAYSHLVVVPAAAEWLILAGQIGTDAHGDLPATAVDQLANCLANIKAILDSEGVSPDALVKINIWLTEDIPRDQLRSRLGALLPGAPPAATLAFVQALARPELKVEIEAWAARMPATG